MDKAKEAAVQLQRRYYTETAASYDTMHAQESVDSPYCLALVSAVLRTLKIHSLLDVGAALPGTFVCGVEPVAALVQQGVGAGVTTSISLLQASGDALPFADASFD